MADVTLRHVSKNWGSFVAVRDQSLEIRDGEFMVLLGPSGCGKTTTMRMIAGLEEPSSGDILIGGQRVNDLPPRERDIAMVFQSYGLYPHMSVAENIGYPLKLRGIKGAEREAQVRAAAAKVELEPLLHRRPKELSGGQRQRVALARAIVRRPTVFLMDEPLSNLDAKLRVSTRAEIKHLQHELGVTTVYVTHDQIEAMTLADRVVVMNHGVIEQVGPPQELYHNPKTRFVAGFIGSPAMNFLPARLEAMSGALRLHLPTGIQIDVPAARTGRYASHAGRELLFGIRPEHLTEPKNLDRGNIAQFELTPEVIEPMGMETLLHLWMDGAEVCCRIDPTTSAEPGRPMLMAADLNHMHLIDPGSGKLL
jgi:multiple sugar transport system ATP-binding protein